MSDRSTGPRERDTGQRRGGPVPRLSLDLIADAVLVVGFDSATISSVARYLGFTNGALYRYVGDRDGMMRAGLVRAASSYEWPELVDDWREVVWNETRAWWSFCEQHPGFATALANTPGMPSPMSRRAINVAVHLNRLGIPSDEAILMVDLVMDLVHDIFHRSAQRGAVIKQALKMPTEEANAHVVDVPEDMVEVLVSALVDDPWPWLARKLELMMKGVGPSA